MPFQKGQRRDRRVHPKDVDILSGTYPACFAVLIAADFVTDWPHGWTALGRAAVRDCSDQRGHGYNAEDVIYRANRRLMLQGRDHARYVALIDAGVTVPLYKLTADAMEAEAIDGE